MGRSSRPAEEALKDSGPFFVKNLTDILGTLDTLQDQREDLGDRLPIGCLIFHVDSILLLVSACHGCPPRPKRLMAAT